MWNLTLKNLTEKKYSSYRFYFALVDRTYKIHKLRLNKWFKMNDTNYNMISVYSCFQI